MGHCIIARRGGEDKSQGYGTASSSTTTITISGLIGKNNFILYAKPHPYDEIISGYNTPITVVKDENGIRFYYAYPYGTGVGYVQSKEMEFYPATGQIHLSASAIYWQETATEYQYIAW